MREVFNNGSSRLTKKVHADNKKDSIDNTWDNDPLPQFIFNDKAVSFGVGLDGDYYFLQQVLNLNR